MRTIISLLFLIGMFLAPGSAYAVTYYVDAAAANDTGNGSFGSPKKYIPSGISLLSSSGGDTLIIRNGTYSGSQNNITTFKAGTAQAYNTIQAETDGGVIITSTFYISSTSNVYTNVIGLKFRGAATKLCEQRYVKFFRCAFEGGQICSSGCDAAVVYAAGSYQLYEDCWFYGVGGRYTVLIYEETNTVFRRCVARRDGGYTASESNPEAVWANYGSANISYQNCIAIDNTLSYSGDYTASFYATGHPSNPASNNVEYIGCIDLNGRLASWYVDTDDGSNGMSFTDCISYGNTDGLNMSNTGVALTLNRFTMGNLHSAINVWHGTVNLRNGLIFNHTSTGSGSPTVTYTNAYNPNSYSGTGVTHVNPSTNGLLYLPRIEAGSTLKTSGQSSGQMGAQVVNRVGASGTLYGETNYNAVTGESLWPWPYEDRIKNDFASVSGVGARGFATGTSMDGSPQTLTNYIWEYLGNPSPFSSATMWTVTASVPGGHGTLSCNSPVVDGSATACTAFPDSGYYTSSISGCGGSWSSGNTYTTGAIMDNCTVTAVFSQLTTHIVTPSAGSNGSISPSSPQTVYEGSTITFTATPNTGYYTSSFSGCEGNWSSGNSYTTGPITSDCNVIVNFARITHVVTPSAGSHGSISPTTPQTVNDGSTTTFTVTPDTGYTAVIQDSQGSCGGHLLVTTYTTNTITADCTVSATFVQGTRIPSTPTGVAAQ